MLLENIFCPVCGETKYRTIFKTSDFRFQAITEIFVVVKCVGCDFIFLNPRPDQNTISNLYSSGFYLNNYSLFYKALNLFYRQEQKVNVNFINRYKPSGKLLDVGCGPGNFISLMQQKGYDVYGIEISKDAKGMIPNALKNRVYEGNLEDLDFPANSFDVVTMLQSLEHMHNLDKIMQNTRRILKPDGILYISVPNAHFFESFLFGPYYFNLDIPRHLYFFTKKTLSKFLIRNGFGGIVFNKINFYEILCTPASMYHSILNFLSSKHIRVNNLFKFLLFIPMVLLRLIIRCVFLFESQNLILVCHKNEKRLS